MFRDMHVRTWTFTFRARNSKGGTYDNGVLYTIIFRVVLATKRFTGKESEINTPDVGLPPGCPPRLRVAHPRAGSIDPVDLRFMCDLEEFA